MTDRTYYIISASIVAVAVSSAAWVTRPEVRRDLIADATERSLGRLVPDQIVHVPFKFHNKTSRPIRIVGATADCTPDGCFGPDSYASFPVTIPPGMHQALQTEFKAGALGSFSHPMTIFTDCEGAPKIVLSVTGQIVDPLGTDGL